MARDFESTSEQYLKQSSAVLTAAPLTIAAWIKQESTPAFFHGVVSLQPDASVDTDNFSLLTFQGASVRFQSRGSGTPATAINTSTISNGVWYHIAGVTSGAASRYAYIDGVASVEETTSITPGGIDRTYIGATEETGGIFTEYDGLIAEVGIWNVALTTAEIAVLASGVRPSMVRPASLVEYYPLYGRNSPETGIVAGGSMTLTNTPTTGDHPPMIYPKRRWVAPLTATAGELHTSQRDMDGGFNGFQGGFSR